MSADGQIFIVGQGGALKAGDTVTLTLSGLPHRATWPANVALVLAAVILAAGAWGARRGARGRSRPAAATSCRRGGQALHRAHGARGTAAQGTVDARAYATRASIW